MPVGAPNIELHKRSGQLILLPRSRFLTSTHAHDRIADAQCLARLQRQFLAGAVTLVQQPDHHNAFGHGGRAGNLGGSNAMW
jgi:hypothetical protein